MVRQADTAYENDKLAYDYFRAKGLTNFQAAGVVGNLDQESGIDPTISQFGGGPGRGIAQWSAGGRWDTADGDNVLAFAAEHGQSEYSLELQLDFIWYELTTFPEYGLEELQATDNLADATQVFEDKYEGCVYANYPVCALPMRIQYAQDVLDNYGSDPDPVDAGSGDDEPTPPPDGDVDEGSEGDDDDDTDGSDDDDSNAGSSMGDGDTSHGEEDASTDGNDDDDGSSDGQSDDDEADVPELRDSSCSVSTSSTHSPTFALLALLMPVATMAVRGRARRKR
jgi:hypothetical protein